MKELIIVRHAKSDWGDASLSDHDRPLNDRGKRDAPLMAEVLAEKLGAEGKSVDAVITSTAVRACTTAETFAKAMVIAPDRIDRTQHGYLASAGEWLRLVQDCDEDCEVVMIFGHNPGLQSLANGLGSNGSSVDHLPTCAVVRVALDIGYWGEIDLGCGKLIECLKPREVT